MNLHAPYYQTADAELERLSEERKYLKLRYENSPWDSGNQWRAELDANAKKIAALKGATS